MKFCPKCKDERNENAVFCNICGSKLEEMTDNEISEHENDISKTEEKNDEKLNNCESDEKSDPTYIEKNERSGNDNFENDLTDNRETEEPIDDNSQKVEENSKDQISIETKNKPTDILTSKTKLSSSSLTKMGTIVIVVILFLLVIYLIVVNTDNYKIKQASNSIIAGNYSEGISIIDDVYTPQAIALKSFASIELSRESLVETIKDSDTNVALNACYDFQNEIIEFENQNNYLYLPGVLQNKLSYYKSAILYYSDYFMKDSESENLYSFLSDAQAIMMNEIDRWQSNKNGNTFKLSTFQNRKNTAETALSALEGLSFTEKYYFDLKLTPLHINNNSLIQQMQEFVDYENVGENIWFSTQLNSTISDLYDNCSDMVSWYSSYIDEALKKWDADDDLYLVEPSPDNTAYVSDGLERIASWDDIYNNTDKIMNLFQLDIIYYLLTGSTR